MIYVACGSATMEISQEKLSGLVAETLGRIGSDRKVIAVPPDITRFHSRAGVITDMVYANLKERLAVVLPALGTHAPMTPAEMDTMYPGTPHSLFRVHDWRRDTVELGRIGSDFIRSVSGGLVDYDYPVQANRSLAGGDFDRIISIGQVVPHEVVGMANHAKNIFVGTGGKEAIDKSHFLGATYGLERMMGRADTPVRKVFSEALRVSAGKLPPVLWMLTVMGRNDEGNLVMRGFFSGDGEECFMEAAALSRQVNIVKLDSAIRKAVVWLDPSEYRTTWLGNKAVYRSRMAMADGGELLILAPGLAHFGEDKGIDRMIRKYGYRPTPEVLSFVRENEDLAENLSAAAHLIHGSSEGRFTVRYAPGGGLSRDEIESVGYSWADLGDCLKRMDPARMRQGWNRLDDGEEIYFISNPAVGLWTTKERFGRE